MQVVAGQRVDVGRALPVGAGAYAPAVVRPAALRLDHVPRRAAALPDRVAVEIVELGTAGADQHLVNEGHRVGERELQPAAAAAAEEAAASAEAAAPAAPAATGRRTTFRRRTTLRRR